MDFLSRLLSGGAYAPNKSNVRSTAHDPQARLLRFKRVWNQILELCNRPRNPETEKPLFEQLHHALDRLAGLIRDESRAPMPHVCLSYAASNHIYNVLSRAAAVSQNEPIIRSTISIFAALVDSEEEDFLFSASFAKSLMRLVKRVIDGPNTVVGVDTETTILELLFTIAAKIRLQPTILPVWFQSSSKNHTGEDSGVEKKRFVGSTQKDDFPLCYLLIDRVHHEGRLGDFARTGLLYILEATGRSTSLEEWVIISDLPTLMASGLGALYSQLSRELSILHPDATLPAVLAMSDYSTTHLRATAESAFSAKHESHMATFLSYLAFWQDVLDHCRSSVVKQSLVDHFQVLFLQQLLYPSLLQSSDTDAGSSVAVLTYLTAMLEALDYPDLIHMVLVYLLNVKAEDMMASVASISSIKPLDGTTSPTSLKRRQSILAQDTVKAGEDVVEPALFSLVDLLLNSVASRNNQTAFAAFRLVSTLVTKQRPYAMGTILQCDMTSDGPALRTAGLLETELEMYTDLSLSGNQGAMAETYSRLCDDIQVIFEAQISWHQPVFSAEEPPIGENINSRTLSRDDPLLRFIMRRLRTFLTNSVDVNLAVTQAIFSIATTVEIRLDDWMALDPVHRPDVADDEIPRFPWQQFVAEEDMRRWLQVRKAECRDPKAREHAPTLFRVLAQVKAELDLAREGIPNFDQLLSSRRDLIQGADMEKLSLQSPPSKGVENSRAVQDSASKNVVKEEDAVTETGPRTPMSREQSDRNASPKKIEVVQPEESSASSSIFQPPPPDTPSTTDMLMQQVDLANGAANGRTGRDPTTVSLNHLLTNAVILEDFIFEIVAILQVRAAVLGEAEICISIV